MPEGGRERQQHAPEQEEPRARQGTALPADPVELLLSKLREDPELARARLSANFLNDVGYILERDGFGAAELYLLDRAGRPDLRPQAIAVLEHVLPLLRACPIVHSRRALGRYLIKVLPAIRQT